MHTFLPPSFRAITLTVKNMFSNSKVHSSDKIKITTYITVLQTLLHLFEHSITRRTVNKLTPFFLLTPQILQSLYSAMSTGKVISFRGRVLFLSPSMTAGMHLNMFSMHFGWSKWRAYINPNRRQTAWRKSLTLSTTVPYLTSRMMAVEIGRRCAVFGPGCWASLLAFSTPTVTVLIWASNHLPQLKMLSQIGNKKPASVQSSTNLHN